MVLFELDNLQIGSFLFDINDELNAYKMKVKKIIIEVIFIVMATMVLIVMNQYNLLEKYSGFALIPILIAYYLGQFVERKIKTKLK